MAVSIKTSVGAGGKNATDDVLAIQKLLNVWLTPGIPENGVCDGTDIDPTVIAIRAFQALYSTKGDGRVDPGGGALKKLNSTPLAQFNQVSGTGFYSYGSDTADRQWGTAKTIATLEAVATKYDAAYPGKKMAVGDISFRFGGHMSPHDSHTAGKNVDLRPVRTDDLQTSVVYTATEYDQAATKALIELFLAETNVSSVLFNDPEIVKLARVSSWSGHDNHFHVTMKE